MHVAQTGRSHGHGMWQPLRYLPACWCQLHCASTMRVAAAQLAHCPSCLLQVVGLLKPDELLTYEQDIGEAMKAHFEWENVDINSDGGCTKGGGGRVEVSGFNSCMSTLLTSMSSAGLRVRCCCCSCDLPSVQLQIVHDSPVLSWHQFNWQLLRCWALRCLAAGMQKAVDAINGAVAEGKKVSWVGCKAQG